MPDGAVDPKMLPASEEVDKLPRHERTSVEVCLEGADRFTYPSNLF